MDARQTSQSAQARGDGNLIIQAVGNHIEINAGGQPYLVLIPASRRFRNATIKEPLDLPKADRPAIDLVGRDEEMARLHQWLAGSKPISVRTLTGKGGAGKTRLALELLSELEERAAWLGGFLREDEMARFLDQPLLSQWRWQQPTLIAIDYAAAVSEALGKWLQTLSETDTAETPPLRFLLLERDASLHTGWYQSLAAIGDSFTFS